MARAHGEGTLERTACVGAEQEVCKGAHTHLCKRRRAAALLGGRGWGGSYGCVMVAGPRQVVLERLRGGVQRGN